MFIPVNYAVIETMVCNSNYVPLFAMNAITDPAHNAVADSVSLS